MSHSEHADAQREFTEREQVTHRSHRVRVSGHHRFFLRALCVLCGQLFTSVECSPPPTTPSWPARCSLRSAGCTRPRPTRAWVASSCATARSWARAGTSAPARPHAEVVALRAAGDEAQERHRLCLAGALQPPRPHATLRGCAGRGGRRACGRGHAGPQSEGRRRGPGAPAGRRDRDAARPAGGAGARAQHRLRLAHAARAALAAGEDRGEPGRPHRAGQRREPVDHRAAGAPRRAPLAGAVLRGPDRDRDAARGRSPAHGARGRNVPPARARRGGPQSARCRSRRACSRAATCCVRGASSEPEQDAPAGAGRGRSGGPAGRAGQGRPAAHAARSWRGGR